MEKIKLYQYNTLDSTQLEAKRIIENQDNTRQFIVLSNQQTNGFGRLNRNWESIHGNIFMSFVMQSDMDTGSIALSSALGVTHGLGINNLSSLQYKWPNDILINQKKICGILIERYNPTTIIIGIGINIVSHPENVIFPATDFLSCGMKFDQSIAELSIAISEKITQFMYESYHNSSEHIDIWKKKAYKLNEEIKINLGNQSIIGRFTDISNDMSLLMQSEEGVKKITYGDIS